MISATSKCSTPFRGLAVALVVADNTPQGIRTLISDACNICALAVRRMMYVQEYPISVRYPLFQHLLPNTTSDKYRRADLNCHLRSEKRYAIFNNDQSRNRTYE